MVLGRFQVLGRLQRAIAKVRFLVSFNLRQWLLSSSVASSHRRLSLDSQPHPAGILDATDIGDELSSYFFGTGSPPTRPSSSLSKSGGSPVPQSPLLRTVSPPLLRTVTPPLLRTISRAVSGSSVSSASDDINQRADEFIENFYRQLRMERQISLELRYCNGNQGGCLIETSNPGDGS
ncbi:hypothetical protein HPP92_017412 [Vanilla planifolia]|uniref:Uncharacterized protein n=1 Tax=Vanilla planifolia TaxID=51239 RepID=A0A835QN30_VANPL|nr:hypothetical protein HPP92_017412 [Vanilla planifolia]